MIHSVFFLLLTCAAVSSVKGNDCTLLQSNNASTRNVTSCFSYLEYCCVDAEKLIIYCCDAEEFYSDTGRRPTGISIDVIVAISITGILLMMLMCCLWFSGSDNCCLQSWRRHFRGYYHF